MGFTGSLLNFKHLKFQLRVLVTGCLVAMIISHYIMKMTKTCPPMIGRLCNTNIATSVDKEC